MRELTHKELDEVAGGAKPFASFGITPEHAPFSIAVPTSGPLHENSPHLVSGVLTRPRPVGPF